MYFLCPLATVQYVSFLLPYVFLLIVCIDCCFCIDYVNLYFRNKQSFPGQVAHFSILATLRLFIKQPRDQFRNPSVSNQIPLRFSGLMFSNHLFVLWEGGVATDLVCLKEKPYSSHISEVNSTLHLWISGLLLLVLQLSD